VRTWAEFEDAALWFSLGAIARPFCRMMLEQHREDVARRRAEAPALMLRTLAERPPATRHPRLPPVEHPHPSRGLVLPPRYLDDQP